MACYHPRYLRERDIAVKCGRCVGCRLEYSRQWAVRCMHEASLYDANAFVTLTYRDEELPLRGSLAPGDLQLFFKRFRRKIEPQRVRFFAAGEYGAVSGRPHYHACLFGFDFPDKYLWTVRNKHPVYRSPMLEKLWDVGNSEIGSVTFESAAYVARYIMKKSYDEEDYWDVDEETGEVFERHPEFVRMSNRPGIGRGWVEKYMCEVYPSDSVVVRGRLMKPPRYYDKVYELQPGAELAALKERRLKMFRSEDQTPRRLGDRERVALSNLNRERGL